MLNKIQLIGYVGRDPDLRYTAQGKPFSRFSLAVSRRAFDTDGERQEVTQWFAIVAWERQAEFCAQYARTGSQVYLEGRMASRSYTDPDGHARTTWEVIASDVQLLGKREPAPTPHDLAVTPDVVGDFGDGHEPVGEARVAVSPGSGSGDDRDQRAASQRSTAASAARSALSPEPRPTPQMPARPAVNPSRARQGAQ